MDLAWSSMRVRDLSQGGEVCPQFSLMVHMNLNICKYELYNTNKYRSPHTHTISIYQSINLSINLSIDRSIHPSINLSIYETDYTIYTMLSPSGDWKLLHDLGHARAGSC